MHKFFNFKELGYAIHSNSPLAQVAINIPLMVTDIMVDF
jgi:hypothetical protein